MVEELFTQENQVVSIILSVIAFLLFMAAAMVLFFYFSRRKLIKSELEKATREIEHQKEVLRSTILTQEEERQRIAQDLHDAISSKLNVVSLNANMLTDPENTSAETLSIADSILKVTSDVLENSRRIAHDLLPPTLQKFGLAAALEELCDEVADTGAFKVRQNFNYPADSLLADQELHFFRITQELFNNAIKYSEADLLELSLHIEGNDLHFAYRDNGKGFNVSEAKMARGLGLSGMANRVDILNATLDLQSAPNEGLLVRITKRLD